MPSRFRDSLTDDLRDNHEINVVPFIDIMLVLLIIFMVAAPLATVDVDVDLPGSNAPRAERPDEPIYLTLKSDLTLALGETPVTREDIAGRLEQETGGDHEARIFLRADKGVDYGEFMEVMNLLRSAGYLKIALVGLEGGAAAAAAANAPDPDEQAAP
ncbi:TonB system transport protein ExbD [Pontibaca methylaminivorans]|uniref:TonB system transport protein ExbD n=1 Tax=Pontibaca methylaminivorans TaxID=515897 RepID=UPI002FD93B2D